MGFRINTPAVVNAIPTIDSAPSPVFNNGTAAVYDMTQHVTDDGLSTLIYGITGSLATGLSFDTATGALSYDGVGAASSGSHELTVDDQVNAVVTSNTFTITINALPGTIAPLMHWDNSTESLTDSPLLDIAATMRTHREGGSNAVVEASEDTPLRSGGGRYLHTKLTNANPSNTKRCERHPIGIYITEVNMTSLGGSPEQFLADNDWWYAFRMRVDQVDNAIDGLYAQWHDKGPNSPGVRAPVTLNGSMNRIEVQLLDNDEVGGSNVHSPTIIANPQGTNHKYIFRIRWDTRIVSAGSIGLIELYIDDETTPRWTWNGQTAHPAPETDGRAPNFKYGGYFSLAQSQGTPGDINEQSYDDLVIVEDVGSSADMRASVSAKVDTIGIAGNP